MPSQPRLRALSPRIRALFGLVLVVFVLYAALKRVPFIEELELMGVDGRRWLKAAMGLLLVAGTLLVYRKLPGQAPPSPQDA